ncbi:MAG: hypothetical protein HZC36_06990 [Armatimonadetes bacterium]|nr:hypothetical protein [Armatimonadota bacterium]
MASALLSVAWAGAAPALTPAQQDQDTKVLGLPNFDGGEPRTQIQVPGERLSRAKLCPKWSWEYEWGFPGLAKPEGSQSFRPRVRVFEQQRREVGDVAEQVVRMMMRLWDLNYRRLKMDHNPNLNFGIIDVYLAFGGKAGGEQLIAEDRQETTPEGAPKKVNTIYIYAIPSFSDPLEMAREVAHEYGHATLPTIGGFVQPEDWANGYLGERLYLRWLRDLMAGGKLKEVDAMGASLADLDKYVKQKVDPLADVAALNGPDRSELSKTGQRGMDAYMGLALYAESTLPANVFARSIKLTGSTSAADYPKAIVLASEEPDSYVFNVPARFANKPIWVPLGKGSVVGQAQVVKKQGDWALVKAADSFRVVNRQGSVGH